LRKQEGINATTTDVMQLQAAKTALRKIITLYKKEKSQVERLKSKKGLEKKKEDSKKSSNKKD